MQRRTHPFFSGIGCSAALLFALALAIVVYLRGWAPFSPGPLAATQDDSVVTASTIESQFESHASFESECTQCHVPWRGVSAQRCETCHTGVAVQRRQAMGLHGLMGDTSRCAACHTDHGGSAASMTHVSNDIFDHARTGFSLARHEMGYDGQVLSCSDCHLEGAYTKDSVDCATCHRAAEPAFMQEHTSLFGADCASCHDGVDSMANFEHASVFALEGAHATVECSGCHVAGQFQETPRECAGCHAEPEVHVGLFGLECERCHSVNAWTPAELTAHTFPLDHGEEGALQCTVCHEQNYTAYTCYNCHEHQPAAIRQEHLEEGIREFDNCVECHPTGREDEGEEGEHD